MPAYLHPGVYIEEIPSSAKPIEAIGTSTACFIGYTVKGPIAVPTRITKFDEYQDIYGGLHDTKEEKGDAMGLSVLAFFQNGGTAAYIVRLAKDTVCSTGYLLSPDTVDINNPESTDKLFQLNAINGGVGGDDIGVKLASDEINSTAHAIIKYTVKPEGSSNTNEEKLLKQIDTNDPDRDPKRAVIKNEKHVPERLMCNAVFLEKKRTGYREAGVIVSTHIDNKVDRSDIKNYNFGTPRFIPVKINTAAENGDDKELMRIPGIGKITADFIIEARSTRTTGFGAVSTLADALRKLRKPNSVLISEKRLRDLNLAKKFVFS